VTVGLDLGSGATSALSRFVVKSPVARSFCSVAPPRVLTWAHFYSQDGVSYGAGPTGSFTEGTYNTQSVIDQTITGPSGRFHEIRLSSTSGADWRVAELIFYP